MLYNPLINFIYLNLVLKKQTNFDQNIFFILHKVISRELIMIIFYYELYHYNQFCLKKYIV